MLVAGIDGCPAGWLVVWAGADVPLRTVGIRTVPTFSEVLQRTRDCAAVGIDMPIGLSDDGRRAADVEARSVLKPLRHSSVFPAPIRAVLGAPNYRAACDLSARKHVDSKKISKQTYYLSFKIAEVDRLMTEEAQKRVVEIHPEVSFWALNSGVPLANYKKTAEGRLQRLELLARVFHDDVSGLLPPAGADPDDLLDACAAVWTAARFARGEAGRLPPNPSTDSRGLRMEIVY